MLTIAINDTAIILPAAPYAPGNYDSEVYTLGLQPSELSIVATRDHWPDTGADVIFVGVDISTDGGKRWYLLVGLTAVGGDIISPWTKTVDDNSHVKMNLPAQRGHPRQIRVSMQAFAPINTSVSVTVT